jgi:septum formation protein
MSSPPAGALRSWPLILASASPARRELLEQAGYSFTVRPANIEEPDGAGVQDIRQYVQEVAWRKAAAVAPQIARGIILAADTVGWLEGQVIGKPTDEADARRILTLLGGREHELWTGVVLWRRPDDLQLCWQECSRVILARLTPAELEHYLACRTWRGCSGAYAVQGPEDPYVQVRQGSLSNVIGLPLETLAHLLPAFALLPQTPGTAAQ